MADFNYSIEKVINGVTYKLPLSRDEVSLIWAYYDDLIHEELIEQKLTDDYKVTDLNPFRDVIDNIMHRYNKNRGYGCDEDSSMDFAFGEFNEEIEKLVRIKEGIEYDY